MSAIIILLRYTDLIFHIIVYINIPYFFYLNYLKGYVKLTN